MRGWLLFLVVALFLIQRPAHAQKNFGFDNRKPSGQPYLKPEESVARMKVADGFEVKLFAAEPDLVNPIAMTVDEKGRVWVIECFEYPKRTPRGKMPRDRIVILEDTDGDGVCDKRTVFAEGKDFPVPFDMASGLEVGNGGVYVGAPPYLFFIENKNDKPGKFEVLLKGFGSQDTHETLNTFQWGPDGWLYGLHGVFTHSEVKPEQADGPGTRLNAAVWRFEPQTRKFEIFSDGTSNPWGMDWRNTDGQFILCCCVIPHLYHMVPEGIYRRQGGQSFNPYAYGEIKEICDHTFHKESGWAHAGLISLDTPLMPESYRNSVIFGSIHGCSLKQNILKPNGSTYTASRGDDFLLSGDKNFRPINLRWGPNGEIYCIDWHDQNPCHQAGADSWDYERGRVYRIQPRGLATRKAEDLSKKTGEELARIALEDNNPYRYRTALRLIHERQGDLAKLKKTAPVPAPEAKLGAEGLVSSNSAVRFRALLLQKALGIVSPPSKNDDAVARGMAIRFLPDRLNDQEGRALVDLAKAEMSATVRREIASLAIRHRDDPNVAALLHELMKQAEDRSDPVIPQLIWIAYESNLLSNHPMELTWLRDHASGNELVIQAIIPRAMRRLVAAGDTKILAECLSFVEELKDLSAKRAALAGMVEALKGRQVDPPANWKSVRAMLAKENDKELQTSVQKLAISFRDLEAIQRSLAAAVDVKRPTGERLDAIRDLALAHPESATQPLLRLARGDEPNEIQIEAVRALASFDLPNLAKELLAGWAQYPPNLKNEVINVLAGRRVWAKDLLEAVGVKKVAQTELNVNTIMRIQSLKDKNLDALVDKVWGRIHSTPAELNELINKTRSQLDDGPPSFARGKMVFDNHCAKCHKFEGRGFEVGPNIEGAARDIEYLLINVLDPNRIIGAPYFIRTVTKLNGQNEIGILAAEDDQAITLKTENGVLKVIPKKDIDEVRIQEKSLMPEGFGSNMKIQEFRDLIRYAMAHPFVTEVRLKVSAPLSQESFPPRVGVTGRIPIPDHGEPVTIGITATVTAPEKLKTKLLLGIRHDFELRLNKAVIKAKGSGMIAQPDQVSVDVELHQGENQIEIVFEHKGKGEAVYLRFHDPDRKLRYPEPPEGNK